MNIIHYSKKDSAQKYLLKLILEHFGGYKAVHTSLVSHGIEINDKTVPRWASRGKIPLAKAVRLGKILKISPYALNYKECAEAFGEDKSFANIVKSLGFLTAEQKSTVLGRKLK